jgi:hypothetical protein
MSPASYGYFLHVLTREVLAIHDHAIDACSNPSALRLDQDELASLNPIQDRIEVLEKVLSKGWIRVRHFKQVVSVEFMTEWETTLETLAASIQGLGLGNYCYITARQIATGETLDVHVHTLREHFQNGTIGCLLDRVVMR